MEGFMNPFDFDSASFMPTMPDVAAGGGIFGAPQAMGAGGQPDFAAMTAGTLAQNGIRPDQFLRDPSLLSAAAPSGGQFPSLGSSLGGERGWDSTPVAYPGGPEVSPTTGQPTTKPLDIRSDAQKTSDEASNASAEGTTKDKGGDMAKRITDTLRGVQMPKPPAPQTVHTPAPTLPRPMAGVKGGQLVALLQALGARAQGATPHVPMPLLGR